MRSSIARLVQMIPRKTLQVEQKKIVPRPASQTRDLEKPTLSSVLRQQQAAAGESWPSNIRIEPEVKKEVFKRVESDVRTRLKKLLKER